MSKVIPVAPAKNSQRNVENEVSQKAAKIGSDQKVVSRKIIVKPVETTRDSKPSSEIRLREETPEENLRRALGDYGKSSSK